jgi:DNA-binding response OmpR family regulator
MTDAERIEALEDRVAVLEQALGLNYQAPAEWRLTSTEERILGVLLRSPRVHRERLMVALYADRADPPDVSVITVHVCGLRAKLKRLGVDVIAMRHAGYWIPADQKQRLLDA